MWEHVGILGGKKIAGWAPGAMMKWFCKPSKLEKLVTVSFPGNPPPIRFLRGQAPQIEVNLRITNGAFIPITIDRILINVMLGINFDYAYFHRVKIESNGASQIVLTRHSIPEGQFKLLDSIIDAKGRFPNIGQVEVTLYCDSKAGPLHIREYLQVPSDIIPPLDRPL
jgi:hypothetical protein